ncbi:MAG: DegT/DnrJ/EryC1/StrS family aminotransferase [Bacteroidota bacterium]
MKKINITKSYLPPLEEYQALLDKIWTSNWVTSGGQMVKELQRQLALKYELHNLSLVSNGTRGLEIATKVVEGSEGEIITTALSYVATTSSTVWVGAKPVFADIDPFTLNVDPAIIRKKVTSRTKGILVTHLFGNPCDTEAISAIAKEAGVPVIYDASHAIGVKSKGRFLVNEGDISVVSLHATKIMHTTEGGMVISGHEKYSNQIHQMANFGHMGNDRGFYGIGVNGKMSELHAAMGLCVLSKVDWLIEQKKRIANLYDANLFPAIPARKQRLMEDTVYNYSYYPLILKSEDQVLKIRQALNEHNIFPRRYFYPALSTLNYVDYEKMEVAEDMARRLICLPNGYDLERSDIMRICNIILDQLGKD